MGNVLYGFSNVIVFCRWSAKFEILQSRQDREKKIAGKKSELLWALEETARGEHEEAERKVDKRRERVQKCEEEMEKEVVLYNSAMSLPLA